MDLMNKYHHDLLLEKRIKLIRATRLQNINTFIENRKKLRKNYLEQNLTLSIHRNQTAIEEAPVVLEETQVVLEEAPVVLEETPVVLEETPVVLEETPVVLEETPVVLEEVNTIPDDNLHKRTILKKGNILRKGMIL